MSYIHTYLPRYYVEMKNWGNQNIQSQFRGRRTIFTSTIFILKHIKVYKYLLTFCLLFNILNEPKYVYMWFWKEHQFKSVWRLLKTKENPGLLSKLLVNNAYMVSTTR